MTSLICSQHHRWSARSRMVCQARNFHTNVVPVVLTQVVSSLAKKSKTVHRCKTRHYIIVYVSSTHTHGQGLDKGTILHMWLECLRWTALAHLASNVLHSPPNNCGPSFTRHHETLYKWGTGIKRRKKQNSADGTGWLHIHTSGRLNKVELLYQDTLLLSSRKRE